MQEELYTIQLTRRELGLFKHYSRLLFANIDDDVTTDGSHEPADGWELTDEVEEL